MAETDDSGIDGGFRDPVFDAQAIFDAAMRALSRPGTTVDFGRRLGAPRALEPAAAAILAALADYDTPIWLDEMLRTDAGVTAWIAFQTGAILVGDPSLARFAVVAANGVAPNLSEFALGTADYPDRSTTLLVTVDALEGGVPLTLSGPGIETQASIAPVALSPIFFADWAINTALFPRGVDVLLVAGTRAIGLPRTTKIRSA